MDGTTEGNGLGSDDGMTLGIPFGEAEGVELGINDSIGDGYKLGSKDGFRLGYDDAIELGVAVHDSHVCLQVLETPSGPHLSVCMEFFTQSQSFH